MNITLHHYLFLAFFIFLVGFISSLIAKQVIKILISIEFMLIGININFIALNSFCDSLNVTGYIFGLFSVAIGAAELAIGLFLFNIMYSKKTSENVQDYRAL